MCIREAWNFPYFSGVALIEKVFAFVHRFVVKKDKFKASVAFKFKFYISVHHEVYLTVFL